MVICFGGAIHIKTGEILLCGAMRVTFVPKMQCIVLLNILLQNLAWCLKGKVLTQDKTKSPLKASLRNLKGHSITWKNFGLNAFFGHLDGIFVF